MHRLLSIVTLFLAVSLSLPEYAFAHAGADGVLLRSEHVIRHRMIKKRQNGGLLDPLGAGVANAAGDPPDATPPAGGAANSPAPTTPAGGNTATTTPTTPQQQPGGGAAGAGVPGAGPVPTRGGGAGANPATTPSTGAGNTGTQGDNGGNGGLFGPIVNGINSIFGDQGPSSSSLSSSTTSSGSSSTSSTSSTTSSSSSTTSTANPVLTPAAGAASSSGPAFVTVVQTSLTPTQTAQDNSKKDDDSGPGIGKIGRNTIIIIVAIAGSIGAAGIIWTIIRKWKFRPSREFEDRIQPIDWQPTVGGGAPDVDGHMRERDVTDRLERSASRRSHGSFTSGAAGAGGEHGGVVPGAPPAGSHDYLTADLPQHDFTAGPAHLAPVGGYADLHRGPSPGPYQYEIPNTYANVQPQQQPYYYDQRRGY